MGVLAEQRLGGAAWKVRGPSRRDPRAELRGAERVHPAAGAGADDDEVVRDEFLSGFDFIPHDDS